MELAVKQKTTDQPVQPSALNQEKLANYATGEWQTESGKTGESLLGREMFPQSTNKSDAKEYGVSPDFVNKTRPQMQAIARSGEVRDQFAVPLVSSDGVVAVSHKGNNEQQFLSSVGKDGKVATQVLKGGQDEVLSAFKKLTPSGDKAITSADPVVGSKGGDLAKTNQKDQKEEPLLADALKGWINDKLSPKKENHTPELALAGRSTPSTLKHRHHTLGVETTRGGL
jgi:hypothetical protein